MNQTDDLTPTQINLAIDDIVDEVRHTSQHIRDAVDEIKALVLTGLQKEIDTMPEPKPSEQTDEPAPKPKTYPRKRDPRKKKRVTKNGANRRRTRPPNRGTTD